MQLDDWPFLFYCSWCSARSHLLLTDIPKDVIGQDAHEGDSEDLEEEREFDAEEQEAGHPETAVVLGETERGISETPEGSDIPILTVSDHYTCQI